MAVAPPLIRRLAWPAAAIAAFGFLLGLALHGGRPELAGFEAAGFMKFTPAQVREVEVVADGRRRQFHRDADWPEGIDAALRLLHDAGPMRVMSAEEAGGEPVATYGLDAGATMVTVRSVSGETFVVRFGMRNPLGSGNYARIEGMAGVPILPAYVGEAWQRVVR